MRTEAATGAPSPLLTSCTLLMHQKKYSSEEASHASALNYRPPPAGLHVLPPHVLAHALTLGCCTSD